LELPLPSSYTLAWPNRGCFSYIDHRLMPASLPTGRGSVPLYINLPSTLCYSRQGPDTSLHLQ
jgi:hypothetical protein